MVRRLSAGVACLTNQYTTIDPNFQLFSGESKTAEFSRCMSSEIISGFDKGNTLDNTSQSDMLLAYHYVEQIPG